VNLDIPRLFVLNPGIRSFQDDSLQDAVRLAEAAGSMGIETVIMTAAAPAETTIYCCEVLAAFPPDAGQDKTGSPGKNPFIDLSICAAYFHQVLGELIENRISAARDVIYFPEANLSQARALARCMGLAKDVLPRTVLRFNRPLAQLGVAAAIGARAGASLLRQSLAELCIGPDSRQIRLLTDGKGLAEEYCAGTDQPFNTVPIDRLARFVCGDNSLEAARDFWNRQENRPSPIRYAQPRQMSLPAVSARRSSSSDGGPNSTVTAKEKIVGLLPGKNEEESISFCLRALSCYVDAIVFLDDCSDDHTVAIVESLAEPCSIERILRKTTWVRDEPGDRNLLLAAGREIGGTHFVILDADEALTSNCAENGIFRRSLLGLRPGERLELPWIPLWRGIDQYRFDGSGWAQSYCAMAFCDDGRAEYRSEFIHTPRVPEELGGKVIRWEGRERGLLHFQFVNWRNLMIKQAWYRCLERIRSPQKNARQINARYALTKDETGLALAPAPSGWLEGYNFFDPGIFNYPDRWRERQVLGWFRQYGRDFFRDLDIWDLDWGSGLNGSGANRPERLSHVIADPPTPIEEERLHEAEGVAGWLSSKEMLALYRLAGMLPDRARVLEIGSYRGRSTSLLGGAIRCTSKELYCLDPWRDYEQQGIRAEDPTADRLAPTDFGILEDFLRQTEQFSPRMRILRGSTTDFKDLLPAGFFDLIFVDGAHDYYSVVNDIRISLRSLKSGGILCGHDFCPDSGKEVAEAVRQLIFSNPSIKEHGVFEDTTIWYGVYHSSSPEERALAVDPHLGLCRFIEQEHL